MAKPTKTNQGASDLAGNLKDLFTGAASSFETSEFAAQLAPQQWVWAAEGLAAAAPVAGAPVGAAASEAAAALAAEKAAAVVWAAASLPGPAARRATFTATSTSSCATIIRQPDNDVPPRTRSPATATANRFSTPTATRSSSAMTGCLLITLSKTPRGTVLSIRPSDPRPVHRSRPRQRGARA